jgi:hypothetical protein
MELAFDTEKLRLICESETEASRQLSGPVAESLHARLADIRAAGSAADLREAAHTLDGQPPARIVFTLDGGYELVCVGNHRAPALTADGLVDFTRLRRLKVVAVTDRNQE